MLTLVSGQPGNGKTLKAMALMEEEYLRNQAGVKAGKEQSRRFFSNVAGSTVAENADAFPWVEPLPADNDWTKLPDGSFVLYDECHSDGVTPGLERYGKLFPATGKPGESDDPRIRSMSTHRHRGFDMVLVTQWPSKVHHNVRQQCGRHIHMNRSMGLAAAGVFTWTRVQPDPYDEREREKAEEEIWSFPKDLYKRYKSSTLHTATYKFKLPKKIKNGLITAAVLALMVLGFWHWMGWKNPFSSMQAAPAKAQSGLPLGGPAAADPLIPGVTTENVLPAANAYMALNTAPAPTLAGCAASELNCRCFNSEGFVIDMTVQQCRDTLAKPLPFNVMHKFAAPRREREEAPRDYAQVSASPTAPAGTVLPGNLTHVGETSNVVPAPEPHF